MLESLTPFEALVLLIAVLAAAFAYVMYRASPVNFFTIGMGNTLGILVGSLILDRAYREASDATLVFLGCSVLLLLGAVARRLTSRRNAERVRLRIPTVPSGVLNWMTYVVVLLVSFAVVGLYFLRGGIPALASDVNEAKVLAQADAGTGLVAVRFIRIMLPLLLLQLAVTDLAHRRRLMSLAQGALLGACALISFLTGFKGYFVYFFLVPLLVVYSMFGVITIRRLLAIALVAIPILAAYSALVERTDLAGGLEFVVARVTATNAVGPWAIINEIVPEHGLFFAQTFVWDVSAFLGRLRLIETGQQNFAAYAFTFIQRDNPLNQQVATTVIGEAYANFGPLTAFAVAFGSGALLDYLVQVAERMPKDPLLLPLVVVSGVTLGGLFGSGPVIYNTLDLILSLAVMAGLYVVTYAVVSMPRGVVRFRRLGVNL